MTPAPESTPQATEVTDEAALPAAPLSPKTSGLRPAVRPSGTMRRPARLPSDSTPTLQTLPPSFDQLVEASRDDESDKTIACPDGVLGALAGAARPTEPPAPIDADSPTVQLEPVPRETVPAPVPTLMTPAFDIVGQATPPAPRAESSSWRDSFGIDELRRRGASEPIPWQLDQAFSEPLTFNAPTVVTRRQRLPDSVWLVAIGSVLCLVKLALDVAVARALWHAFF